MLAKHVPRCVDMDPLPNSILSRGVAEAVFEAVTQVLTDSNPQT